MLVLAVLCALLGTVSPAERSLKPPVTRGLPSINQLIEGLGLLCTNILVTTEDGYQIWLHRMGNNTGTPVLFVHGFGNAADIWLSRGLWDTDLAYMFVKEGFDVYLTNLRGNTFNPSHTKYKRSDIRFWDFSVHELGYYDVPAMIDWILNARGLDKIIYVGHSLGTTNFLIMASKRPEYNAKIKLAVLLAPVAFPDYNELSVSFMRIALIYRKQIKHALLANNQVELMPRSPRTIQQVHEFCAYNTTSQLFCLDLLGMYFGENRGNVNRKTLAYQIAFTPAGFSTKLLEHLGEIFATSNFAEYDYGSQGNLLRYNSTRPPRYPVEKVTAPVALFWSYNDNLVSVQSVARLRALLPNIVYDKPNKDPRWTHFDYHGGISAKEMLYYEVVDLAKRYR